MLMLFQNKKIPHNLWGCIDRESVPALSFRTAQGVISYYIRFTSIRFFDLGLVSVVNNMAPIIIVVLAYFMLKE